MVRYFLSINNYRSKTIFNGFYKVFSAVISHSREKKELKPNQKILSPVELNDLFKVIRAVGL